MSRTRHPNVSLPYRKPRFITYHWLASSGIPAFDAPSLETWYYNQAIGLECRTDIESSRVPGLDISIPDISFWHMPFMKKYCFNNQFLTGCVKSLIQNALEEGYYVSFCTVDDYYVEGKSMYHERHFLHDGLICGVDNVSMQYQIAAYDCHWKFRLFSTSQKGFVTGFSAGVEQGADGDVVLIKYIPDIVELDLCTIQTKLSEYLGTIDGNISDRLFGMRVQQFAGEYIDLLKSRQTPDDNPDRRIFRMLWEHKNCMLDRIRAVEQYCNLQDEFSLDYAPLVEWMDDMRMIYLKYCLKRNVRLLDAIQEKIKVLTDREAGLLDRLCAAISS